MKLLKKNGTLPTLYLSLLKRLLHFIPIGTPISYIIRRDVF